MKPLAQLNDVCVSFDANDVLHNVNASVSAGECLGISGANGSGKTTLLRVFATLQQPTSGSVTILPGNPNPRLSIGFVGHEPSLNSFLSLRENLEFVAELRGIAPHEVARTLTAVGLDSVSERRTDTASQGMRRRTDLARIAMSKPTLLMLDEPYSGLDADAGQIVDQLIENTTQRGGAVVVVSHQSDVLSRISDSVLSL